MFAAPKIILCVLICLAVLALVHLIRKDGADSVRSAVERQNNAAGSTADDARGSYDRCPDGLWDFGAGRCGRSPARGGN